MQQQREAKSAAAVQQFGLTASATAVLFSALLFRVANISITDNMASALLDFIDAMADFW